MSNFYRMLGAVNVRLQPEKKFCIKSGYHEGKRVEVFDDHANTDEWQRYVYEYALTLFKETAGKAVIDIGCGSGYKLVELFGNYETTGIELPATYEWLRKKYTSKKWMTFDNAVPERLSADLLICSDVIEHVENPDQLMDFLRKINFKILVLSTPERNRVRGEEDFGPPENTSHYREWSEPEFREYVSRWFRVTEQVISNDKSVSQILICENSIFISPFI